MAVAGSFGDLCSSFPFTTVHMLQVNINTVCELGSGAVSLQVCSEPENCPAVFIPYLG